MNNNPSDLVSTYQQYLPSLLQEDQFIRQFLLAFETILSGLETTPRQTQIITANSQKIPSLESVLDNIDLYFDPQQTPEEFLPWLANWVALSLRDDWDIKVKRAFIQKIVGLYQLRGTKAGLTQILSLYLESSGFGKTVEVFDDFDNFPHYFQVQLTLKDRDPDKYWRQAKIAKAIIDQEKPAHTFYALKILVPTMQLTKRSHFSYPFKLFPSPQNQIFTIEVRVIPNQINSNEVNQLAKQLIIQLQGNSTLITPDSVQTIIDNQSFAIQYQLNYQQLQNNLDGFSIKLSNRTDKDFLGNLTVKLYFNINEIKHENILLEQSLNLSPVLKICRQNEAEEMIEGNTIFKTENQPQTATMRITEYLWSQPYHFKTFSPPKSQQLQPNITAIIDKIELTTIVEITQPNPVTRDLLNKITVRLQDHISDFHLFTPETTLENNKIIIKRRLYYPDFMVKMDQLFVTIKNLNEVEITGQVMVQVSLTLNQRLSTYDLLSQNFTLSAISAYNILQICRNKNGSGGIDTGKIPTILGTTSQSLTQTGEENDSNN